MDLFYGVHCLSSGMNAAMHSQILSDSWLGYMLACSNGHTFAEIGTDRPRHRHTRVRAHTNTHARAHTHTRTHTDIQLEIQA